MNPNLIKALICIILTFAAYTLAVRKVSKEKKLEVLQLLLLWLAFCGNTAGAGFLKLVLGDGSGFLYSLRGICIIISIVILFVHAIWGTALMLIPDDKSRRIFLRDTKLVWKIWIVILVMGIALHFLK
ncbi:MAG: hypothetical protein IKE52_00435 [Mogibacterium sp.]|nr:hypothetical protein [Mogibacterium sp.]